MKRRWIVTGFLGISSLAFSSVVFGQSYQFSTVINAGDPLSGDAFLASGQVVTNNQGDVGILAVLQTGDLVVDYANNTGSGWNNTAVEDENNYATIVGLTPSQQSQQFLDGFQDLAITSSAIDPNLSFQAQLANGDNGILQYDSQLGTVSDVAFDNDTKGYTGVANDGTNGGSYQVNPTNQALFPAVNPSYPAGTQNVIVYGNPLLLTEVFRSSSPGLSNAAYLGDRVGVGTDGSSAAVLQQGSTPDVYLIPANGGTPTPLNISGYSVSLSADPYSPIVGYTSGVNGFSGAAVVAVADTTNVGQENLLLSTSDGSTRSILPPNSEFTSGSNSFYGQLDPNGQFAAYIPGTASGNTIQYANLSVANAVTKTIATEEPTTGAVPTAVAQSPSTGYTLPIISLQNSAQSWNPNVNSNGTVVFPANMGTSSEDPTVGDQEAILLWQTGDTNPQIVLSSSADSIVTPTDVIDIEGYPAVINDFDWNDLGAESDYNKSSLSDNYLALDVDYTYLPDMNNPNAGLSGNAVIITSLSVPEPASMGLLSIAALGLIRRRKRA